MDTKNFFKRIYFRFCLSTQKKQDMLKQAVRDNDLQTVYNLVKAGADVNFPYRRGFSDFDEGDPMVPQTKYGTVSVSEFAYTEEMKMLLKFLGTKTSKEIKEDIQAKEEEQRKNELRKERLKKEADQALLKRLMHKA